MTEIVFGRLQDLPPREAWAHEAQAFTPWLARNIDQLSEAVGIPLELTGQEVRVEAFAADILARNPSDDSLVLIENQLEATDHTHLGQILTYLAGLEAKTVVWIAPRFREPHLSAVRWLNEHTSGFAFFAVRLRLVRIADSPYAPIFEVVEKPYDWDRQLRSDAEVAQSDLSARRAAFWSAYLERHPEAAARGLKSSYHSNMWLPAPVAEARIGLYLSTQTCGAYVRGSFGVDIDALHSRLLPHREILERRLGVPLRNEDEAKWLLVSSIELPFTDQAHWPQIIDWMEERTKTYFAALGEIAGEEADGSEQ